jgi:hypothetical protein
MRRILVEGYRRKQSQKHGGNQQRVALTEAELGVCDGNFDILAKAELGLCALGRRLTRISMHC